MTFSGISHELNIERCTAAGIERLIREAILEYISGFGEKLGGFFKDGTTKSLKYTKVYFLSADIFDKGYRRIIVYCGSRTSEGKFLSY